MKKWLIPVSILLILSAGYYFYEKYFNESVQTQINSQLKETDFPKVLANSKAFIGAKMVGDGLIENSKYVEGEGVYTGVILKPEEFSEMIVLYEKDRKEPLRTQTYIDFSGEVMELNETASKLAYNQKIIQLNTVSLKTKDSNVKTDESIINIDVQMKKEIEYIIVEVEKIDVNPASTRVSVSIENKTEHEIFLNKESVELVADGELIPNKYELLNDHLRLKNSIEKNSNTKGVLSFKKISIMTEQLDLKLFMMKVGEEEPIEFNYKINISSMN